MPQTTGKRAQVRVLALELAENEVTASDLNKFATSVETEFGEDAVIMIRAIHGYPHGPFELVARRIEGDEVNWKAALWAEDE